ncbi:hypothetical protein D3C78_1811030 [compost metagenome]
MREIVRNDALQIVNAVQISVRKLAHFGLDIARDGDIHQQHRLITARFKRTFHHSFTDDRQRAGG